ncbi:hypothetical protein F5148DRAFT_1220425 [Russula earlei]|uniref:Uncharacterized protein n=1 Tax=Russula earlei TaxID=71964 RepID=A0ACC0U2S6_9AGAM|nr:hypothetical protein F5148DRAFT_1220425 [Russula earlei]
MGVRTFRQARKVMINYILSLSLISLCDGAWPRREVQPKVACQQVVGGGFWEWPLVSIVHLVGRFYGLLGVGGAIALNEGSDRWL